MRSGSCFVYNGLVADGTLFGIVCTHRVPARGLHRPYRRGNRRQSAFRPTGFPSGSCRSVFGRVARADGVGTAIGGGERSGRFRRKTNWKADGSTDRVSAMRPSFFTQLSTLIVTALPIMALTSCVADSFQRSSFELVVEGNEASYPAFEAAAKECAYTAYRRFPGAVVTPKVAVRPHFNLSRTGSRAAKCAVRWVTQHPETGLTISGD